MKQLIALLLAFLTIFLSACSAGLTIQRTTEEEGTKESLTQGETEAETDQAASDRPYLEQFISSYEPKRVAVEKLSWEKLDSFPKANETMTPDEARELTVSFFRFCQTFAWIPDSSLVYERKTNGDKTSLTKGTVYGGLPYGHISSGTVYRLMDFYNPETGVVNLKKATPEGETLYFANQCSMGAYQGWGRVINSAQYTWTQYMVPRKGFLPVGPYTYDKNLQDFTKKLTTEICKENGEQTMFRSYAAMQPADGVVRYSSSGHVMMCSGNVKVVYNADGTINGEESSFTILDQAEKHKAKQQADGSEILVQGGVDAVYTFQKAFQSGYLPFTFAEYLGADPIETAAASVNLEGESVTTADLKKAKITANYSIADVYLNILNGEGTVVYQKPIRVANVNHREMELATPLIGNPFKAYENGLYQVQLQVQLYTGDRITLYQGTLATP